MKIHPVFHVVKLKPHVTNEIPERTPPKVPDPIVVDGHEEFEVEEIIDSRRYRGKIQYLVKWKNFPIEANSWEPSSIMKEDVPEMVKKFHKDHPNAICAMTFTLDPEDFKRIPFVPLPEKNLRVIRLSDKATLPTRGSEEAAGLDLYSAEDITVPAKGKALVDLQLSMAVPSGCYGRIAPRSGLAVKHAIDVGAGVIDPDYRGTVKVLLFNLSDTDFQVKHKDRIAQLIFENITTPAVIEVTTLEDTLRGHGGFGSTGISARRVASP
jgi:deoxyuridine 5'-triphosphate nucleotidohydrolase